MELTLNGIPITVDPIAAKEIVHQHLLGIVADIPFTDADARAVVGTKIILHKGEVLIGIYTGPDGRLTYAILLPGVKKKVSWNDAGAWAKEQGGDLANRIEGLLLFTYHRALFDKDDVLWLNEQGAGSDAYAWFQSFYYGDQSGWRKVSKDMARAVRRVSI